MSNLKGNIASKQGLTGEVSNVVPTQKVENNQITCYSTGVTTQGVQWSQPSVIFNSSFQVGDKLTLTPDNKVLIGEGITWVEVSATLSLTPDSYDLSGDIIIIEQAPNGSVIDYIEVHNKDKNKTYHITPRMLFVDEGCTIRLAHYTDANENIFTTTSNSKATSLTVKAVG